MLFLLRNIRRKLLQKNKVTTYFLYAIGEILLVVIGILIAVNIDDWNAERNALIKQEKQLLLIRNEMASNLALLVTDWESLRDQLDNQNQFLNLLNSKVSIDTIQENVLLRLFYNAFNDRLSTSRESVALNELTASGGLKELRNDSIRNALASWDSKLKKLRNQESNIEQSYRLLLEYGMLNKEYSTRLYVNAVVSDSFNLSSPEVAFSNKPYFRSREFDNITITIHGQSRRMHSTIYPQYKKDLLEMIAILDKELNNQ